MKLRHFFAAMAFAVLAMPLSAQVKAKWGNTDTRYPVEAGAEIKTTGVNSTAAWRGERVNFQLLVSNAGRMLRLHTLSATLSAERTLSLPLM